MRIALYDAEKERLKNKTFPNYALMKISAWHKAHGDTVEWVIGQNLETIDKIYVSKIFDFTPDPLIDFYWQSYKGELVKGGTGYGLYSELPKEVDEMFPDYSIYPECDYAIGFLTRGCIRNCEWCVVPRKEGKIRAYRTIEQIARLDTDKIVFMDNNVLACDYGLSQLRQLVGNKYVVDFNQGLDVRLVTEEIVDILKGIKWTDFVRFSCDSFSQVEHFERVMPWFRKHKMTSKIYCYLLVRNDVREAETRLRALMKINKSIHFYAQAERNIGKVITPAQEEFALRYIYGRCYYNETWQEYCQKRRFDYL